MVEHFAASMVGLPSKEMWVCEPDVVKLRPKEIGTVRVKISVSERGGMVAGPYVLGVLVQSPYQREVSRCEELYLDLQPIPSLTMDVRPEVATGGKVGDYGVDLVNEGNTPLAITLAGTDQENLVGFDFSPRELRLVPGMAAGAQVGVHCAPPWTGQEKRRTLTLRAHAGEVVVDRPVSFVQRPRIRGGVMKVTGMTAALAIRPTPGDQRGQPVAEPGGPDLWPAAGDVDRRPTGGATTTTGQTTSGQNPTNTAKFVDFAKDLEETGEKLIASDRYQPDGLILATSTERAPRGCEGANAQALRRSRDKGLGAFLTSANPLNALACNNMPPQFVFVQPANQVSLGFTGLGAEYRITVQYSDGHTDERVAKSTTPGQTIVVPYDAQPNGTIKSVTFWHSNPDPNATDFTCVKSVGWTPK